MRRIIRDSRPKVTSTPRHSPQMDDEAPSTSMRTPASFLEYACRKWLGPPAKTSGDVCYWKCPFHDPDAHPSFHVMPPHEDYAVKFKCHPCDAWGDEFDLLKQLRPQLNFDGRLRVVRDLEDEYEALCNANPPSSRLRQQPPPDDGSTPSQLLTSSKSSKRYNRLNDTNAPIYHCGVHEQLIADTVKAMTAIATGNDIVAVMTHGLMAERMRREAIYLSHYPDGKEPFPRPPCPVEFADDEIMRSGWEQGYDINYRNQCECCYCLFDQADDDGSGLCPNCQAA